MSEHTTPYVSSMVPVISKKKIFKRGCLQKNMADSVVDTLLSSIINNTAIDRNTEAYRT